jgi:hypothetical protein
MKKLLFVSIIALLTHSCNLKVEEEISWKLQSHPEMLVVESIMTNELKHQSVFLTVSSSYYDTIPPRRIRNAVVSVTDGTSTYTFSEDTSTPGLYLSDIPFAGIPLRTYDLSIQLNETLNGQKNFLATSKMQEGIDLDSIKCEIYEMPQFDLEDEETTKDTTILAIYYFGKEPAAEGNHYLGFAYRNGGALHKNMKDYNIYDDSYRNGAYFHYTTFVKNVAGGDQIRFRILSIEKWFYKFIDSVKKQEETGNAYSMSGPPANAIGNVSEGKAFGYFVMAYVSEKTDIAIDTR